MTQPHSRFKCVSRVTQKFVLAKEKYGKKTLPDLVLFPNWGCETGIFFCFFFVFLTTKSPWQQQQFSHRHANCTEIKASQLNRVFFIQKTQ
jgi:hypothetical protein